MLPESLECRRPFVQRPDGFGIRLIKFAAAIAAHLNEANVSQDPQMLRYGRLFKAQRVHDVTDGSFAKREKIQYFPAAGIADGVKCVRRCCRSGHGQYITFPYGNMSSNSFGVARSQNQVRNGL